MTAHTYPFVTGGVEGWNLVDGQYNEDHAYEILQDVSREDWLEHPLYALRVDGEWLDGRAQGATGLATMRERIHAMNRVWHRKYRAAQEKAQAAFAKAQEARRHQHLPNWGTF